MTCNIVGTIVKSGNETINGKLIVKADAPLVDISTIPDTTHLPIEQVYPITGGVVNINLFESQTSNVTYEFKIAQTIAKTFYYFASNNQSYFGATHVHTDGLTYTGATHTVQSVLLTVGSTTEDVIVDNFHAIVPNQPSVEFSQLRDAGITTDTLDTSQRRIAEILQNDQDFIDSIKPRYLGEYDPGTYYGYTDSVSYNGSSWIYINRTPSAGNTPTEPSIYWQVSGKKGDPGGTGGIDTPYDTVGWNGSTNAPSQNAIRDIIETLARRNDDLLTDPTFNTQPVSDVSLKGANTTFVDLRITERASNLQLGTNATAFLQVPGDNSNKIASTGFVKTQHQRYTKVTDNKTFGTGGGNSVAGINIRDLNQQSGTGGDVVALSGNTMTIRAGVYKVHCKAPAYAVLGNRLLLWNVTAGSLIALGYANYSPANVQNFAELDEVITIIGNTDVQLHHYCESAVTGGLGGRVNQSPYAEIYSSVVLQRID